MRYTPAGIPIDDGRDEDITSEEWAAIDGAHERHVALVLSDPTARALCEALLAEINQHQEGRR